MARLDLSQESQIVSQDVIEGYDPGNGLLNVGVSPGNVGPMGNIAGTGTNDGMITELQVCGVLSILQADAARLNGANITYNRFGPNSSSALRYMLQSLESLLGSSGTTFLGTGWLQHSAARYRNAN